jgi:hypothetical protein
LPAEYKLSSYRLFQHGRCTTIDFSSIGIAFATADTLPIGGNVEISVDWPAKIDEHCALRLVAVGRVARSGNGRAAVQIYRHEFKTRGEVS